MTDPREGPGSLTDTHCHLSDPVFADAAAAVARARAAGVTRVVAVGSDPATNLAVLALAASHAGVLPAFGYHPEHFHLTTGDLDVVEEQALTHRGALVALGEVGLPWYSLARRSDAARRAAEGRTCLARLLALAKRLDLSVSLHAPHGAAEDALELLDRSGAGPAVFHWHKAEPGVTRRIVERGHFVGVTPEVVYEERDRVLVSTVPLQHVLLESDGPWPYRGEFAGRPGEPAMVARAADAIADVLGRSLDEVLATLAANTRRFFAFPAEG